MFVDIRKSLGKRTCIEIDGLHHPLSFLIDEAIMHFGAAHDPYLCHSIRKVIGFIPLRLQDRFTFSVDVTPFSLNTDGIERFDKLIAVGLPVCVRFGFTFYSKNSWLAARK